MISEKEVESISRLADITIPKTELGEFTSRFNNILEYFDILDKVEAEGESESDLYNILREDEITPSLPQEETLKNAGEKEDGYIRAPKVM
ncbi:MAG: Asp-tRNA(Asn)/Glu-tRNA(Gln) amidotransferase subunit GatC [Methanogenium sp.]|nr:Asp-tRNA(Asn)/Glu-tRNA(Gln) amidotransferase subunit GatC [Methanogenium sp.]